ncbi:hypothetical protein [Kaistia soli]|uniref:hypothetical protein n=1 Tax=Kaistia soli TaxID=446684 RepID=UPI001114A690|nr:hypothetical protein [Kaistia soli]
MAYSFARIDAVLSMKVEDVFIQNRRLWVRLHDKGGKQHEMPRHHDLDAYLQAYIDTCGLADDPKGPLFRTIGRGNDQLTTTPLTQPNAYAMVRRRAAAALIPRSRNAMASAAKQAQTAFTAKSGGEIVSEIDVAS